MEIPLPVSPVCFHNSFSDLLPAFHSPKFLMNENKAGFEIIIHYIIIIIRPALCTHYALHNTWIYCSQCSLLWGWAMYNLHICTWQPGPHFKKFKAFSLQFKKLSQRLSLFSQHPLGRIKVGMISLSTDGVGGRASKPEVWAQISRHSNCGYEEPSYQVPVLYPAKERQDESFWISRGFPEIIKEKPY